MTLNVERGSRSTSLLIESNQVKLVCSTIFTNRRVPHNRPGISIVLKDKHQWLMVDAAVGFRK